MVNIGIPGNKEDVKVTPAAQGTFLPCDGEGGVQIHGSIVSANGGFGNLLVRKGIAEQNSIVVSIAWKCTAFQKSQPMWLGEYIRNIKGTGDYPSVVYSPGTENCIFP